jgi:holin-like protein
VIRALAVLIGCELLGEALRGVFRLPVPGAVLGMLLLAAALIVRDRLEPSEKRPHVASSDLDRTADALISHMGLLFVPAGVGVIAQAGLLKAEWLPILGGVLGSTLLGLVTTALVMHFMVRSEREAALGEAAPEGGPS